MKFFDPRGKEQANRRTPHGVRGLKYRRGRPGQLVEGRTPHGVRGLKYSNPSASALSYSSHPTRGAWIEILTPNAQHHGILVAPHTGCVD